MSENKNMLPRSFERWMTAVSLLTLILTPPVALLIGLLLWWRGLRTHKFLAYHGAQIAIWQLTFVVLLALACLIDNLAGILSPVLAFVDHPGGLPNLWLTIPPAERIGLLLVLLPFLANVIVAVWGAVATARGRLFSVPLTGWLIKPPIPATPKDTQKTLG